MKMLMLMLLLSTSCWAQGTNSPIKNDGNRLLQDCGSLLQDADANFSRPSSNAFGGHWCLGYLNGYLDGFDAMALAASNSYANYLTARSTYICIPPEATIGQDARVLVKWLNDHPERLHEDAGLLIFNAFQAAFPCQPRPSDTKKPVKKH